MNPRIKTELEADKQHFLPSQSTPQKLSFLFFPILLPAPSLRFPSKHCTILFSPVGVRRIPYQQQQQHQPQPQPQPLVSLSCSLALSLHPLNCSGAQLKLSQRSAVLLCPVMPCPVLPCPGIRQSRRQPTLSPRPRLPRPGRHPQCPQCPHCPHCPMRRA